MNARSTMRPAYLARVRIIFVGLLNVGPVH